MKTNLALTEFQEKSLTLLNELLPLSDAVFFLVENNQRHKSVLCHKGNYEIELDYTRDYAELDPLNLEKFKHSDVKLATLDSQIKPHLLKQSIYFQDFMAPNNHRYVLDLFLRIQGDIVAVISLLRELALDDFNKQEIVLLNQLQPFLEFSLTSVYLPERIAQRQSLNRQFDLTDRELDVLDLLMRGMTNKAISSELGVSLATVKTHLIHIYRKCQVSSRGQLMALI